MRPELFFDFANQIWPNEVDSIEQCGSTANGLGRSGVRISFAEGHAMYLYSTSVEWG